MKKTLAFFVAVTMAFAFITVQARSLQENNLYEKVSFALFDKDEKITSYGEGTCAATGSLSKIFTAALVLKLCEEGELSLDGKVTQYLPEFSMADERYKDITVRQLLDHTSGLMGTTMKNSILYKTKDSWNHDNFLKLLGNQRLKYAPGSMANYCNDGYSLLELIIEKVSGMSYTDYLGKVFRDCSLKTAADADAKVREFVNSVAAGGIYADAENVCRAVYLLHGADSILTPESAALMQSKREGAKKGEEFGLGWDSVSAYPFDKYGVKALSKGGDTLYYHSALVTLPGYGITACVILKGGDSRLAEAEAKNLIIDYLQEKYGKEIEYYPYEKPAADNTDDMLSVKEYEGLYLSGMGQLKFSLGNGFGILTDILRGKSTPLTYLGNGIFDAGDGIIYFCEDDGKTYMMAEGLVKLGEKEAARYTEYYGVKTDSGGTANEAWHKRNNKLYFMCDEKYNSVLYMQGISAVSIGFSSEMPGYLSYMKTVSDNEALSDIALPGTYGRDLTDIKVFTENDKEYIRSQECTFVGLDYIPSLYPGEQSFCTILSDGYTRWFKSGEAKGRKINAEIKGEGMVALYDATGMCVYSSLKDSFEAVIPENGYIAFSGVSGTVFEITLA